MRKLLSFLLVVLLAFSGCGNKSSQSESGNTENTTDNTNGSSTVESSDSAASTFAENDSEMFTDRDYEVGYDENKSALIQLNGDSATCNSDAVEISGTTITIKDEGTYIFSGTLNNGMIIVNAGENDKPQIVLDNATIHSETSAPLYILEADKVFVTLATDSVNTFSNGGTFTAIDDNNIDATIFSKQDLTLNGAGSLTVTSPAGHGIVSKDDLVFTSGTYTVTSASHGLDANDSVRITNATMTIDAGKDGIHAENNDDTSLGFVYIASGTLDISSQGDGISAEVSMQIQDGTFNIVTGGGSVNGSQQTSDSWGGFMGEPQPGRQNPHSMSPSDIDTMDNNTNNDGSSDDSSTSIKGLKSTGSMLINNGTFTIDSADDAIHSNASIHVNSGTFTIASGDDGIHADESLTISGGTINITESYEGLEALDITISGGDISLVSTDDGLNAAGGTDSSGFGGTRGDDMFGGGMGGGRGDMGGGPGGMGGNPMGGSSNGSITISGGNLYINASGDGIDANGSLTISGGFTTVCGPTQGDTATLDYDTSAIITGGTFIGTGAAGMAQTFSDSEQGVISVSVGNQSAGTTITLTDANGNIIISYAPELSFGVVILSSPDIISGENYTITVGTTSGEFKAD